MGYVLSARSGRRCCAALYSRVHSADEICHANRLGASSKKGVFAATGSSASRLAKHVCSDAFGLEGSLRDGPWSYRGAYAVTTLPLYTAMLVGFGTAARRGAFFRRFAHKMWARMLPGGAA